MQLRKIPGVKSYRAAPAGVREALQSSGMSKVAEAEASRIAAAANAAGDATYGSRPQQVRAGHHDELRSGASVCVVTPNWRDTRDKVLVRTAEAMARRSPRE